MLVYLYQNNVLTTRNLGRLQEQLDWAKTEFLEELEKTKLDLIAEKDISGKLREELSESEAEIVLLKSKLKDAVNEIKRLCETIDSSNDVKHQSVSLGETPNILHYVCERCKQYSNIGSPVSSPNIKPRKLQLSWDLASAPCQDCESHKVQRREVAARESVPLLQEFAPGRVCTACGKESPCEECAAHVSRRRAEGYPVTREFETGRSCPSCGFVTPCIDCEAHKEAKRAKDSAAAPAINGSNNGNVGVIDPTEMINSGATLISNVFGGLVGAAKSEEVVSTAAAKNELGADCWACPTCGTVDGAPKLEKAVPEGVCSECRCLLRNFEFIL